MYDVRINLSERMAELKTCVHRTPYIVLFFLSGIIPELVKNPELEHPVLGLEILIIADVIESKIKSRIDTETGRKNIASAKNPGSIYCIEYVVNIDFEIADLLFRADEKTDLRTRLKTESITHHVLSQHRDIDIGQS